MTHPPRVALVTCEELRDLTPDDRLLRDALAAHGVEATPQVWDADVSWDRFDAVMLRSCWDYHLRYHEFIAWVDRIERAGVTLWNPAPVVRWNAEKSYLSDLVARGIDVVPTCWVDAGDTRPLVTILEANGWDDAVVKPAISASAHETRRVDRAGAVSAEPWFRGRASEGRVLVQPFVREVVAAGEWSLVYFDGEFSHATLKRPASGDFRVQPEHGGTSALATPEDALRETGARIVAAAPAACVYARVDGCVVNARFLLMELEVIEPALFFRLAAGAADRVADTIARRLEK